MQTSPAWHVVAPVHPIPPPVVGGVSCQNELFFLSKVYMSLRLARSHCAYVPCCRRSGGAARARLASSSSSDSEELVVRDMARRFRVAHQKSQTIPINN